MQQIIRCPFGGVCILSSNNIERNENKYQMSSADANELINGNPSTELKTNWRLERPPHAYKQNSIASRSSLQFAPKKNLVNNKKSEN